MVDDTTASLQVEAFDLRKTLECGQCFRWDRMEDGSYTGVVKGRLINARQIADQLVLSPVRENEVSHIWIPYFDLTRDYDALNHRLLSRAPWMKEPLEAGSGLRILRQDPWETTISFIFSSNNHIPRISASLRCLSETWGSFIGRWMDKEYYAFPAPEQLKKLSLDAWRQCGAGYRAPYLAKTVQQWEQCYHQILSVKTDMRNQLTARCLLENLPGVGPKVSACISLFGLGQHRQFPVDVWVRRRVKSLWRKAPDADKDIEREAVKLFGDGAGYAQQLIFYEARKGRQKTIL